MSKTMVGLRLSPVYFDALENESKKAGISVTKMAEKVVVGSMKKVILGGKK